ncbi:MAG: thermonuclease family protein [Armatimonadetes bacterium]|nr:thermonuclease family protein [Armatimonadota bacterium]
MSRSRSKNIILPIIILVVALIYSRGGIGPRNVRQSASPKGSISGKCVAVSDGDTIRVLYANSEVKVRLFGIDCPEKKQAFGSAAKKFTSEMVFGEDVNVDVRDTDRYGRSVGWVTTSDGRALNEELVRAGMAWWYSEYAPYETQLASLEKQARAARRGLWSDKNPTPPWEFRSMQR